VLRERVSLLGVSVCSRTNSIMRSVVGTASMMSLELPRMRSRANSSMARLEEENIKRISVFMHQRELFFLVAVAGAGAAELGSQLSAPSQMQRNFTRCLVEHILEVGVRV